MKKLIVAFEGEAGRARIKEMLEAGGLPVSTVCRSGGEVSRAVRKAGGGVVVCGYKLTDMTAEQLSENLLDIALVLLIATPPQMDLLSSNTLFKLSAPVTRGDLLASVRMLMQMEGRIARHPAVPKRGKEEESLISQAKELLMKRNCMTEEEAHRLLQKKSMDTGTRMVETARMILGM